MQSWCFSRRMQEHFREIGKQMRLSSGIKHIMVRTAWNSHGQTPIHASSTKMEVY